MIAISSCRYFAPLAARYYVTIYAMPLFSYCADLRHADAACHAAISLLDMPSYARSCHDARRFAYAVATLSAVYAARWSSLRSDTPLLR